MFHPARSCYSGRADRTEGTPMTLLGSAVAIAAAAVLFVAVRELL